MFCLRKFNVMLPQTPLGMIYNIVDYALDFISKIQKIQNSKTHLAPSGWA